MNAPLGGAFFALVKLVFEKEKKRNKTVRKIGTRACAREKEQTRANDVNDDDVEERERETPKKKRDAARSLTFFTFLAPSW